MTEIGQLTGSFYQTLEDLRGATQRLEDLAFKLGTLNETVELVARIPRIQDLLALVLQTTMRSVRATLGSTTVTISLPVAPARPAPEGRSDNPVPPIVG